jgi:hypothetical protein
MGVSGLACGAARDVPSAFVAMRHGSALSVGARHRRSDGIVPTIVFHGDGDRIVNSVNGDQIIAQSMATKNLATTISHGKAPGGMSYTRTIQTAIHVGAMGPARRRPCVVRRQYGGILHRPTGARRQLRNGTLLFSVQLNRVSKLPIHRNTEAVRTPSGFSGRRTGDRSGRLKPRTLPWSSSYPSARGIGSFR